MHRQANRALKLARLVEFEPSVLELALHAGEFRVLESPRRLLGRGEDPRMLEPAQVLDEGLRRRRAHDGVHDVLHVSLPAELRREATTRTKPAVDGAEQAV